VNIFIPSMDRADKQITLQSFTPEVLASTHLVVPQRQFQEYYNKVAVRYPGLTVLGCPDHINVISATRQWILEHPRNNADRFMMVDDDVMFYIRKPELRTSPAGEKFYSLRRADPVEVQHMISVLHSHLNQYVYAGVSFRTDNWKTLEAVQHCRRQYMLYCFRKDWLLANHCRYETYTTMDDFDMALQVFTKGQQSLVLYDYAIGQPGSNTKGGSTSYRTSEVIANSARALHAKFPDFVRTVLKTTKTGWKFVDKADDAPRERLDVNVQWGKAYKWGHANNFRPMES
jgi:hypothetical protein